MRIINLFIVFTLISILILSGCVKQKQTLPNYKDKNQFLDNNIKSENNTAQKNIYHKDALTIAKEKKPIKCYLKEYYNGMGGEIEFYVNSKGDIHYIGKTKGMGTELKYDILYLLDENKAYFWHSGMPQGTLIDYKKLDETNKYCSEKLGVENAKAFVPTTPQDIQNIMTAQDYTCEEWQEDQKKFQISKDINFFDVAAQYKIICDQQAEYINGIK